MEQILSHGCCGDHRFEKPTQVLSEEHRVIERVLDVLERLAKRPVAESLGDWKKALDFFRHFADECHHHKEEKVLFPAMEAHGIPRDGGPIGVMLAEHEEGRSHVRAMIAAVEHLEGGNPSATEFLLSHAGAYLAMLREHIQKEDDILFRIADEVIPPDEQRELLKTFEEHETLEMGAGIHEKYLKLAEELEGQAE